MVDAVGGDHAPAEQVAGAVLAAREFQDTQVLLVGPAKTIEAELEKNGPRPANIEVLPATQRIGMHESPVQALREKMDSSIAVGIAYVADGMADAFVSAGNTGAVVAASSLGLRRLPGVQRPGIAVPMIAVDHPVVVIDAGANMHCRPTHMLQYGLMADVFARNVLKLENPRVGLLNVGEEDQKGTDLLRKSFDLLSQAPINFQGNIEAKDIFFGRCDIVVCEGFCGNVLLKTCESIIERMLAHLKDEIRKKLMGRLALALFKDAFADAARDADYAEYGGAPLLGINGVTIISHGHSDAKAIMNAVREARSFLRHKVNEKIAEAIRTAAVAGGDSDA